MSDHCRWERDTRYYEARRCEDLFGAPCVVVTYGRIATRLGQMRTHACGSAAAAADRLASIGRRRLQRGYRLRSAT